MEVYKVFFGALLSLEASPAWSVNPYESSSLDPLKFHVFKGVGGEYPASSTSASEAANEKMVKQRGPGEHHMLFHVNAQTLSLF